MCFGVFFPRVGDARERAVHEAVEGGDIPVRKGIFLVSPRNCLPDPGNHASRSCQRFASRPAGRGREAAAPERDRRARRAYQLLPAAGAYFLRPPGSVRKVSARTGAIDRPGPA